VADERGTADDRGRRQSSAPHLLSTTGPTCSRAIERLLHHRLKPMLAEGGEQASENVFLATIEKGYFSVCQP